MYRTKDFVTWEMGMYNPLFIASQEDRHVKPGANVDPEIAARNETAIVVNNSDKRKMLLRYKWSVLASTIVFLLIVVK